MNKIKISGGILALVVAMLACALTVKAITGGAANVLDEAANLESWRSAGKFATAVQTQARALTINQVIFGVFALGALVVVGKLAGKVGSGHGGDVGQWLRGNPARPVYGEVKFVTLDPGRAGQFVERLDHDQLLQLQQGLLMVLEMVDRRMGNRGSSALARTGWERDEKHLVTKDNPFIDWGEDY